MDSEESWRQVVQKLESSFIDAWNEVTSSKWATLKEFLAAGRQSGTGRQSGRVKKGGMPQCR